MSLNVARNLAYKFTSNTTHLFFSANTHTSSTLKHPFLLKMSVVPSLFTGKLFANKLLNGVVMIFVEGFPLPWTGSVVATKSGQTIIFTAAHCLKMPNMSVETVAQKISVMFYGDPIPYVAQVCCCLMNSEILFLRINRNTNLLYNFWFAPKEQQHLTRSQPVTTYAHPHGNPFQSCDGVICSEEFQNPNIGYDKEMIFFNHRADLAPGCSGAAIFNDKGFIVGLQTAMYAETFHVMGPEPFNALLAEKEELIRKASEMRQSTMVPGSVQLAIEQQNMNEQLAKVRADFSDGSFTRKDMIPLKFPQSGMKIAVHVKYIDMVLRTQVFFDNVKPLETLIEETFISAAAGSSRFG